MILFILLRKIVLVNWDCWKLLDFNLFIVVLILFCIRGFIYFSVGIIRGMTPWIAVYYFYFVTIKNSSFISTRSVRLTFCFPLSGSVLFYVNKILNKVYPEHWFSSCSWWINRGNSLHQILANAKSGKVVCDLYYKYCHVDWGTSRIVQTLRKIDARLVNRELPSRTLNVWLICRLKPLGGKIDCAHNDANLRSGHFMIWNATVLSRGFKPLAAVTVTTFFD